ncbi:unnamed protein product [Brassica oleracea]
MANSIGTKQSIRWRITTGRLLIKSSASSEGFRYHHAEPCVLDTCLLDL